MSHAPAASSSSSSSCSPSAMVAGSVNTLSASTAQLAPFPAASFQTPVKSSHPAATAAASSHVISAGQRLLLDDGKSDDPPVSATPSAVPSLCSELFEALLAQHRCQLPAATRVDPDLAGFSPWWASDQDASFPPRFLDAEFGCGDSIREYKNVDLWAELGFPLRETKDFRSSRLNQLRQEIVKDPKHALWVALPVIADLPPDEYRVDAAGNVLGRLADASGPLGWNLDHAFPWSLGGLTTLANLHMLHNEANKHVKNDCLWHTIAREDLRTGLTPAAVRRAFAGKNFWGLAPHILLGNSLRMEQQTAHEADLFALLDENVGRPKLSFSLGSTSKTVTPFQQAFTAYTANTPTHERTKSGLERELKRQQASPATKQLLGVAERHLQITALGPGRTRSQAASQGSPSDSESK